MCDFCKGKDVCKTAYGEFRIKKIGYMDVLQCSVDKCPPHSQCCNKEMNVEMAMQITFCPMCGRKLVEE